MATSNLRTLPASCTEVLISVNPRAGTGGRRGLVDELVSALEEQRLHARVLSDIGELSRAAGELLAKGTLRGVVAAGGDGTLRLVAAKTPTQTPLATLPLGTENLLSKYLDVTPDPRAISQVIAGGHYVQLDAGEANGQLFVLMAGCGFDADVVRRLHSERQGNIHHLSYAKPILDSIRNYEYPLLRVYYRPAAEGRGERSEVSEAGWESILAGEISGRWVFVVNIPRYAGGLNFAPEATGSDGLLDVCTFKEGSLWNGLLYLGGVMLGQHQSMQDFACVRTGELRVESQSPAPYQLDGDPGGELPLTIRSLPGRLRLLVTREWAERHGFEAEGHNRHE